MEVFCGCMAVTTSLMFSRVPTCCPWDCKYGEQFDVLKYGDQILATIVLGILWFVMFGTPCTSLSFARWPTLRDWLHPKGKRGLTQSQQEQVANGNKLVEWTAVAINSLVAVQCYFILENLLPGWMWVQPEIMAIWKLPTVVLIETIFQQFGAPYLKSTGLLSNLPYIWWMSSKADMDVARVPLRGQMF